ncbi:hypothetical protein UFOVP1518_65 [uncultured Caudovirales phage]|jgi:hypothetical protein|uniref:Uncharacterized protein n=1 Tax=uncultured Caudovirales phage TaxID=2100421 RepID=A0A6J5SEB0_9CAUD|nr:hypothetical protein UFOVP475_10 [uncultured Caudovirales phage]CAB4169500.1 hypothetical protein UFOVP897_40 [uncultured Caudovirales phage]CAB4175780.1 hypothetical protein UFOVP984_10 [uncultured Caudovirales phage]CAB4181780.1 hypothetical protein UFOVP1072_63 [uncultured Caudovirales phage]CAB4191137.1 hypothetical protein UFOVP1211_9 [uncultured Caudovirales phage]
MSKEEEITEIKLDEPESKFKDADVNIEKTDGAVEEVQFANEASVEPEDGIEDLKRRLNEERAARIDAENKARNAYQHAQRATSEVDSTNLQLVSNAIDTLKRDNDIFKSNYRDAMSIGDFERAADIQEAMGGNSAKILQLEQGRVAMQNKPKQAPVQQQQQGNAVENFARQLSPRSATWIRRNPDCVTNPKLMQKMIAAHNIATADGIEPDSDSYFAFVENTIGLNRREASQGDASAPVSSAAAPTQRRSSPAAAPVTRSGTASGSRPNIVRLTADEREMASNLKMTDQEYARNREALRKEGKLSH